MIVSSRRTSVEPKDPAPPAPAASRATPRPAAPVPEKPAAPTSEAPSKPVVLVPAAALKDGAVFILFEGKAVRRVVKTGAVSPQGVRIEQGLNGGEDVIVNPPAGLKDGDKVRQKS